MGRLGRRHRSRARRPVPGALLHRAGLVRTRRAHRGRRALRSRPRRRRRMDAPARAPEPPSACTRFGQWSSRAVFRPRYPLGADGRRNALGLCDRLRRPCTLQHDRGGPGLHAARGRRPRDHGGGGAARADAGGLGARRVLRSARLGVVRRSAAVACRALPRRGGGLRLWAGPSRALALARDRHRRRRGALGAPDHRSRRSRGRGGCAHCFPDGAGRRPR